MRQAAAWTRRNPAQNRRRLLRRIATFILIVSALTLVALPQKTGICQEKAHSPNIVLILTDDQGYGDLGCHGNPVLKTPNLDRLAFEGVELEYFYVSPVCSPTRASLLTGRWSYRTGVVDTFLGRAMMHGDEVTLAEMLATAGYRTGIFGKWHLGDNYPLRAIDQGFQESLVLRGGGIAQPADYPPGNHYTDPVLVHNGRSKKVNGYCTDIFTDAAIEFIEANRERPFFVYLAYNCPHTPLEVDESYRLPFADLDHSVKCGPGHPLPGPVDANTTARVYGMVTQIDQNVGRLLSKLDDRRLADDTIVVFLTDNGPQQVRYNAGLLERKGSVHEGGIRVPCFVRWPSKLRARAKMTHPAAHIDIMPTLLDACAIERPKGVTLDGTSLLPLLKGEGAAVPERLLFFQWHRGEVPEPFRACAVRGSRYKLVQPLGTQPRSWPAEFRWKLFDLRDDPYEMRDIASEQPEIVARLTTAYEEWFAAMRAERGFAPPWIVLGSAHENPSILTRQDWRGPHAGWGPNDRGHWEVEVAADGEYQVTLEFPAPGIATRAVFELNDVRLNCEIGPQESRCVFSAVRLGRTSGRLAAWVGEGEQAAGAHYVIVDRVSP